MGMSQKQTQHWTLQRMHTWVQYEIMLAIWKLACCMYMSFIYVVCIFAHKSAHKKGAMD